MAPRITKIGRVGNQFSIGPSIFWTPFFLVGHFANKLSPTIDDYQLPGFNAPYQIAVSFGSIIYFLIGLVFLYQGLKKFFSEKLAFWLTSISWLISPLVYYLVYEPSMSHALDFFILTILFYYFIKFCDNNRPNNLIVLGIILGLAMLIRWQNLLFGLLPLYLIFQSANKLKSACYFLLAVFLIFSPQLLMWKYLYGSSILAPQGSNFFNLFTPHLGKFLFSGYHGLFIWHPLLIFGVIGLLLAFKKQVVWLLFAALILQIYINSALSDWMAGGSFGARRLVGSLFIFIIGLGFFCQSLQKKILLSLLGLAIVLGIGWNTLLLISCARQNIPINQPVTIKQLLIAQQKTASIILEKINQQ